MKGRVVVLGQLSGRGAAALMVDGRLDDLLIDPPEEVGPLPGAIFRARAGRPMKGQGGMFVDLPGGAKGFLRDPRGIAPGAPLLVQLSAPGEPGKAPPVSRRILFKSRHAIVTPGAPGLNISRRIDEAGARARLTALAGAAMEGAPEGMGLILRSAAEWAGDEAVRDDIARMRDLADRVMADTAGPPELLVDGPDAAETAWRDWADPPPDAVEEGEGAFARSGAADAVEALLDPRVALPGGGAMWLEPTRALIAVDVNTGGDTSPAAGLKANIAAARDLPRQLRLRGLGGMVVVDFAPMPKRDRATLEQQLRTAFRGEAAETTLAGWTPLGNMELQRKRDRWPLAWLLGEGAG